MAKRHWQAFFRRPSRRGGEKGQLLLSALLGVGLALLLIHQFDASLRPQMVALAEAGIRNQLTRISDQAVTKALSAQALSYSDMVILQSGQSGEVTTLSTDTVRLNLLRAAVLEDVVTQTEALGSEALGIPFGALTGLDLLAAFGPSLPVRVLSVASVEGTYRNEFADAGINQTIHRVMLDISITARLLFPGGIETVELSVPVPVAETIIIGGVPDTYLNWNNDTKE